jgi:acetamidase/formamidase
LNKQQKAQNSTTPHTHYAPSSVVMAPGPLFWDIAPINDALECATRAVEARKRRQPASQPVS